LRIFKTVYTEQQVNAIENYYLARLKNEQAQKERAQALVKELTDKMNHKNNEQTKKMIEKDKEIEKLTFFVAALTVALTTTCEAIQRLKESENV
jgi:hypothetical protein